MTGGELAGVISTGVLVAGSLIRLGWSVAKFGTVLDTVAGAVEKNGEDIAAIDGRLDDVMTKGDCKERSDLILRYVNGRPE